MHANRNVLSGVSIQRKTRNVRNVRDVRDVTQLCHYWIGILQAAAANHSRQRRRRMRLARCQAVADMP